MLKNYLTIAWRNLIRNRSFSIINILGLAIGMASAALILLWCQYVASADQFHSNLGRLYEVFSNDKIEGMIRTVNSTPEIMAPELTKDFPEIESASRINWSRNLISATVTLASRPGASPNPDPSAFMSPGFIVDPDFLTMFSLAFVAGDPRTALKDPHGIVITQQLAQQLFHTQDAIGRTVNMGGSELFKVTGVIRDIHKNSFLQGIDYLCAYGQQGNIDSNWTNLSIQTYVLLKPNTRAESVDRKIGDLIARRSGGQRKTQEFLYPVSRVGLHGQFVNGKESGGLIDMVQTFTLIAAFIILIACINFINLSTAYSQRRAKEVGIRKATGALRSALLVQFLGESLLAATLAGIIALLLVQLVLPAYDNFVQIHLHLDYQEPGFWALFLGFILLTGILAGGYPAFVLSSFKPVAVLKGRISNFLSTATPRKVLVVVQFTIGITLIISTLIVRRQIEYAQTRQIGYDRDRLVNIPIKSDNLRNHAEAVRNELLTSGAAVAATEAFSPLTENWGTTSDLKFQGSENLPPDRVNRYSESGGLIATTGMQLVHGRDIDPIHFPTDSSACLINEAALAYMKFKDPIGQVIRDGENTFHVVGVVKNYIQESPYQPVRPMIIEGPIIWRHVILVRLSGNHPIDQDLATAEKIVRKFEPLYPFEYSLVDEDYARKFDIEKFVGRLATIFTGLVIFISCLGLFGLAAFTAHSRIKEIGIRKVLGASVVNISLLLSKDFIKLIALSILFAVPTAWLAMTDWLSSYDYHISIGWDIFALSGVLALLIAFATVSYQSIKAALIIPVRSLRAE
jgi:ABC-type antimicrobial peptide transport system permease subunit